MAPRRSDTPLSEAEIAFRKSLGISPNYRGDPTSPNNQARNLPDELNCTLWVTGLPADITVEELLGQFRDLGRVFYCLINRARPQQGHPDAAAKLTWFEKSAAQRVRDSPLTIREKTATIIWNFYGYTEKQTQADDTDYYGAGLPSRAIIIFGAKEYVNHDWLERLFKKHLSLYAIAEIVTYFEGKVTNSYEYRFGSYYCQAMRIVQAIRGNKDMRNRGIHVIFARDPCAPAPPSPFPPSPPSPRSKSIWNDQVVRGGKESMV